MAVMSNPHFESRLKTGTNMLHFTVYDNQTGKILRHGQTQSKLVDTLLKSRGESLLIGEYDGAVYYVDRGRAFERPALPDITVTETGLTFAEMPPDGTTITVRSRFIDDVFEVTGQEVSFAVADSLNLSIHPPFPAIGVDLDIACNGGVGGDGAQIITPDLGAMKEYFAKAVPERAEELTMQLLDNPSESTQKRWLLKRAIFDRFEAGNLSEADRAALAEEVRYSGATVEEHLAVIGAKIGFQNWVTFRLDGLRSEAEARLNAADTPEAVVAIIAWAEAECTVAVTEAQALTSSPALKDGVPSEAHDETR
jgi:hypothetical protein